MDINAQINIAEITRRAKVPPRALGEAGKTRYSIADATPREVAQILDALFRHQFGIRPFADEGDDYPVGAEW